MTRSDRPLPRKLAKLAMTLRHGRRQAHRQDWWPGLSLDLPGKGAGVARWHGRDLLALRPFAEFAAGAPDAMTIVGSGPSIADTAVETLPDRSVFLLNGAVSLMADRCPHPYAVFVEDERFVHRHHALLTARVTDATWCALSVSAIRALAKVAPAWLAARRVVPILNLARPYLGPARRGGSLAALPFVESDAETGATVSTDPARGITPAGTVAYTALQFALATGASRIALAGVELTSADAPRFYESAGGAARSGLLDGLDRTLAQFALARRVAEARGVAMPCHAPGSALLGLGYPFEALSR